MLTNLLLLFKSSKIIKQLEKENEEYKEVISRLNENNKQLLLENNELKEEIKHLVTFIKYKEEECNKLYKQVNVLKDPRNY